MTVLVTGGTGQLGSALVEALIARGDSVRCLVRDLDRPGLLAGLGAEQRPGDVTDPESLASAARGVEQIYHLAGIISYWPRRRSDCLRINVEGTRNVLDAAAAAGARRLVLTSSIATLGYNEGGEPGDESTPYNWGPFGLPYSDSKLESERLALAEERLEVVAVNPGIVFGANDVNRNAGKMLIQVANGGPPSVPVGATTVVNLEDAVAGHLAAMARGRPGERYVLASDAMSFRALYAQIATSLGRPAPTRTLPGWVTRALVGAIQGWGDLRGQEPALTLGLLEMSSRDRRYRSDKASRELGFTPTPIARGIDACRDWYRGRGWI